jgi:hypothetical protein
MQANVVFPGKVFDPLHKTLVVFTSHQALFYLHLFSFKENKLLRFFCLSLKVSFVAWI